MLARENFDGLHVWDMPGLSGYLVSLVHLVVRFNQINETNQINQSDSPGRLFQHPASGLSRYGS
jgi:hypothetical protein